MAHLSPIEKLLAPLPRDCGIVTVIDGHPAALGWLGSVRGHRVEALGVEHFGQTGTIGDLYRNYGIDANAIIDAAETVTVGAPVRHRQNGGGEQLHRHSGAMRSIELWCAIAHLRISRFPDRRFASVRNDDGGEPCQPHIADLISSIRRKAGVPQMAGSTCRAFVQGCLPNGSFPHSIRSEIKRFTMVNRMQFYIDGAWVDPVVKKSTPVINPATERADV